MSDGLEVISLYYDPYENAIYHENGNIVDDDIVSHLISYDKLGHLKGIGGTEYVYNYEDNVRYEIIFPVPDKLDGLYFWYNEERNTMHDRRGYVVYNMFAYVSPQELYLFKTKKQDMQVYGKKGNAVHLIYGE